VHAETFAKMYRNLWKELCSHENLELAYKKARKHKTTKEYVIEFEKSLENNLLLLRSELLLHCYKPKPLVNFIIRDPKTRKISKSHFRDRVIHHALCNIIEPIFDKTFIHDSYANRIGKGALAAVKRFEHFKRKASRNNTLTCYVLKADISKYFESVNHKILMNIIKKKIKDKNILWLIKLILANPIEREREREREGNGMPLGNLTSQFFANVYLNELDQYSKHKLKVKYYIRYVDDFVILHNDKAILEFYKREIDNFLKDNLKIELHKDKSKIVSLDKGVTFLGFRIFYYHKLLKKSNIRKIKNNLRMFKENFDKSKIDYDKIYDSFEGWIEYVKHANTYKFRKKFAKEIENSFPNQISIKEINRMSKKI